MEAAMGMTPFEASTFERGQKFQVRRTASMPSGSEETPPSSAMAEEIGAGGGERADLGSADSGWDLG